MTSKIDAGRNIFFVKRAGPKAPCAWRSRGNPKDIRRSGGRLNPSRTQKLRFKLRSSFKAGKEWVKLIN